MTEAGGETREHGTVLIEPSTLGRDVRRYALSMMVAVALGAGIMIEVGPRAAGDLASDVDSAVLIDLPPAAVSSAPASNAAEGPRQRAMLALAALEAPKDPPRPVDEPKPVAEPERMERPLPPVPEPPAVLERKEVPTPRRAVAPAARAQPERSPSGAKEPSKTVASDADESQPHATRHAITLWQRSLLRQLDTARRLAARQPHATGTVKISFSINLAGALASEHVVEGSGSSALDQAALLIVKQAAPFMAPPAGSGERDTLFILSIKFR